MRCLRRTTGAAAALVLALGALTTALVATLPSASAQTETPKVTICHRTNSVTNPYEMITVDESAVNDSTNASDHLSHTGPVFDFNNPPPPPHNGDQWGDIVPPFDENGNPRADTSLTLNWNLAGQAVFNNDCVPGNATVNVKKMVTGTGTPSASQAYSIELKCTLDLGAGATQVLDETVSLTDGQTSADFNVQAGAVCTATEDTTGLTNLVSATNDGPKTLVAVDGTYTITETNDFLAPTVTPAVEGASVEAAAVAVVASPVLTG